VVKTMFGRKKYTIGVTYMATLEGEPREVTLISKTGLRAHILVRDRSISMDLDGSSTPRTKQYHQAVPTKDVWIFSLRPIRKKK